MSLLSAAALALAASIVVGFACHPEDYRPGDQPAGCGIVDSTGGLVIPIAVVAVGAALYLRGRGRAVVLAPWLATVAWFLVSVFVLNQRN